MPRRPNVWNALAIALMLSVGVAVLAFSHWYEMTFVPTSTETIGNFTIKSYRTEDFGRYGHRRILYYRGRTLADQLADFVPSPIDGERAMYERGCATEHSADDCGLFYFDGHVQRTYRLDPDTRISLVRLGPVYANEARHPWSPDGRFVIIPDQFKMLLVNLQTGSHIDLAERLDAQALQQPQPPTRQLYFAGWSPSVQQAAVVLFTNVDKHPPAVNFISDVYTVDPETGELAYRCTAGPSFLGDVQYSWSSDGRIGFSRTVEEEKAPIYNRNTNAPCD